MKKPPAAPPVYRPQLRAAQAKAASGARQKSSALYRPEPKPIAIQHKATLPVQKRTPSVAVPAHQPHAVQLSRKPTAPPVYKPEPKRVAQMKPVAITPGKSRLTQVVNRRPTTLASPRTIQLLKVKEMEKAYVKEPSGDEQVAVHNKVKALLAKHAEEDVGDVMKQARLRLASLVLQNMGGQPTYEFKMMAYFLGLRGDAPASLFSGLGSLKMSSEGRLRGRPGFLSATFSDDQTKGAPGRAFRHRSAWHYIKEFLNTVLRQYGPDELENIYDSVYPRVPFALATEADKILAKFRGTRMEHKALWLAIVMNSARSNLWLGPSKENISINSSAYHLKNWTTDLDFKRMSLAEYRKKVAGAKFGSKKAREVREEILKIIDASASQRDPLTYVVSLVMTECVSRLEIDLPDEGERESAPHHMRIYEIAHDIGGLGDRLQIIEALLDLEPSSERSESGMRRHDRRRTARDWPYPASRVILWGPLVAVDSLKAAAERSWNAGDRFELPDGRRYGVRSDYIGSTGFVNGDLQVFLRGG